MFTGIVEEIGKIKKIGGGEITVSCERVTSDIKIGDSVAVNGVCLTVTSFDKKEIRADVMPETLRRSSLKNLRNGDEVNLERALTLSSRLGGHIVSGHIDGTGTIKKIEEDKNARVLTVGASRAILRYIVEKGSVAVDGVSLTVVSVSDKNFTVSLIPHTNEETVLHCKRTGDEVNIENDIIGKYVEKFMMNPSTDDDKNNKGITKSFLLENGF
ncbi:MAG: riboflavin synthase [Schwartzia sp.]|nr:riboflavin synthase [Schwartzia sp. (in: firmicutes)]